jgi:hypothetical protein
MPLHSVLQFSIRAAGAGVASLLLLASVALAEVPNTAQDALLGEEGQGPRDRFTSVWHVDCLSGAAGRRCEVTLQTADRESQNYVMQMRYPIRFVVDGDGRHIEFPFDGASIPPEMKVDLILDGRPLASVRAADRVGDPGLFDRLANGRQLLVSTGSFAEGRRVRAYVMLDGLSTALADAQRQYNGR